ncbi:MAG: pyrroline-5-carboxylate reductase [Clostridium sp.]|nr:pyrroline-5-carboxylate reductase [Clostridium sp.]
MKKIIGFIGGGNMGGAIIGGIIKSNIAKKEDVFVADLNKQGLNCLADNYGVNTTTDNKEVAKKADILFLSVKPNVYKAVIEEIKDEVKDGVIIVVIAAGKSINEVQGMFGKEIKVVRVMPNTPALVGEGMAAISPNSLVTKEETEEIKEIFDSFGKSEVVGENLMDAVTGVSGSSPAFVYMFIEAMADSAVLNGMPRQQAYKFAAQTVLGSAKMVLETGKHPGELKDMVTSPGGTTIEGVTKLEELGMRNAVIQAQNACIEKSKKMSK